MEGVGGSLQKARKLSSWSCFVFHGGKVRCQVGLPGGHFSCVSQLAPSAVRCGGVAVPGGGEDDIYIYTQALIDSGHPSLSLMAAKNVHSRGWRKLAQELSRNTVPHAWHMRVLSTQAVRPVCQGAQRRSRGLGERSG